LGMVSQARFEATAEFAKGMDAKDPLAKFRERFYIPKGTIYVDGNSLGLCPKDAERDVLRALDEWKDLAIKGFMQADPPWFYMAERLGGMCADLVGAEPDEVVCTGTTTANIHALLATFYRPEGKRNKLLADELDFPGGGEAGADALAASAAHVPGVALQASLPHPLDAAVSEASLAQGGADVFL